MPLERGDWHVLDEEYQETVCGEYTEPESSDTPREKTLTPQQVCSECVEQVDYLYEGDPDYDMVTKFLVPTGPDLKAMRAVLGITQAELAELADSTQASISNYENRDNDMYSHTLNEIVQVLRKRARAESD